jgi:tetratricopeptide (TPR) repeat protein
MTVADPGVLRQEGNTLLKSNDIRGAISKYTEGISIAPNDHLLYSNRSAAFLLQNNLDQALDDATRCIQLAPRWGKSYTRRADALFAMGKYAEAKDLCTSALELIGEEDVDLIRSMLGKCEIHVYHKRLKGAWRGRVANEMGGYLQTMTFGENSAVRIDVFGRHQNCKYSLDLSKTPSVLTILFGSNETATSVPYRFEFRDEDQSIAMCCPFLVPELPEEFTGPGFVLMDRWNGKDTEDINIEQRRVAMSSVKDPQDKMRLYLDDFAKVIAEGSVKIDPSVPTGLQSDDEIEANKKVIQVMSMHVKITELEEIYGKETTKTAFGIISQGDEYATASVEVKLAADRLRDLLLSTGFLTPEGLEQARLQYTKAPAQDGNNASSRTRLQRKLIEKNSRKCEAEPEQSIQLPVSEDLTHQAETDLPDVRSSTLNTVISGRGSSWIFIAAGIASVIGTGLLIKKVLSR